jgi:folate-dependent phosphoribosylglycinamide formyltransferase PurN
MNLVGLVIIDNRSRVWGAAKREIRRVGWLGFLDVVAFRLFSRLWLRAAEKAWKNQELARLRARYPATVLEIPKVVVANPNADEAREFLTKFQPDLLIARCKFILKPDIFSIARVGAFALHPGICPEYRNAHGCFWALANRDLDRVGMTLLKIDEGVDTGPVYFQGGCLIDEVAESHIVIQYRVVLENLEPLARTLIDLCNGAKPNPIPTAGRRSAVWGQPRLSAYLRWKRAARRKRDRDPFSLSESSKKDPDLFFAE